jgi:hypothetical protein
LISLASSIAFSTRNDAGGAISSSIENWYTRVFARESALRDSKASLELRILLELAPHEDIFAGGDACVPIVGAPIRKRAINSIIAHEDVGVPEFFLIVQIVSIR